MKPESQAVDRRPGPASRSAALAVSTASLLVSLGVGEVVLRVSTPFPISTTSNQREHAELLYVNAGLHDLDALGFRNRSEPAGHQVFAIGDSHTFGFNVSREHAWPQRLREISELPVYNFGAGGYNVYHYYRLFQLAVDHGARQVIVALYPANDVEPEACRVLGLEYWRRVAAEVGLSVGECEPLWRPSPVSTDVGNGDAPLRTRVRRWLTAEVAMASALYYYLWDPVMEAASGQIGNPTKRPDLFVLSEDFPSANVTRSRVSRHRITTDLDRPAVRQHFENSLRLFRLMRDQAEREGVSLSILVVPSKERVIANWAQGRGQVIPSEMAETLTSEEALTHRYLDLFEALGLRAQDLAPRLVDWFDREVTAGGETYREMDGHPMESGYLEYARGAAALLSAGGSEE